MRAPDWSLWRSFAAVVEEGSLSAAARKLGLSQPTLGRHIESLEQSLSAVLFERRLTGLNPTETALTLFEQVTLADQALANAATLAQGRDLRLSGTVRITASTVTAHYSLPPFLRQLRNEFPDISLDIVPSDSAENLLMRESDIAVRMFRPTQLELVTRKLGQSAIVCCAHTAYLEKNGTPKSAADLYAHDMIGLDRSDLLTTVARQLGLALTRDDFVVRSDNQTVLWELIKAGVGLGFAQKILVSATPDMHILPLDFTIPPLEVWLTTHPDLFTSRRIRVIYDRLGDMLSRYYADAAKGDDSWNKA